MTARGFDGLLGVPVSRGVRGSGYGQRQSTLGDSGGDGCSACNWLPAAAGFTPQQGLRGSPGRMPHGSLSASALRPLLARWGPSISLLHPNSGPSSSCPRERRNPRITARCSVLRAGPGRWGRWQTQTHAPPSVRHGILVRPITPHSRSRCLLFWKPGSSASLQHYDGSGCEALLP
jgi:hypothetical protein